MNLAIIIITYLISAIVCGSLRTEKTAEETGNEIERFLSAAEGKDGNGRGQNKNNSSADSSKKFMEDLIEVQRTYRNLKAKWQRIMEEKGEVIRVAREEEKLPVTTTTTITSTVPTSSGTPDVQEIDIDVFEAPDKFQDISESDASAFDDDDAFIDISAQKPATETQNELEQIQNAIHEAFHPEDLTKAPPTLFEIIGPKADVSVTTSPTTSALLETFGSVAVPIATEWRRKLVENRNDDSEDVVDPFEAPSTTTSSTTTPRPTSPSSTTTTTTTTSPPTSSTTTTTPLPLHILPKSTFISSGANPDALPATNLFRYPNQVEIPFFGTTQDQLDVFTQTPAPVKRPTTPEAGEVDSEDVDGGEEEEEEVVEEEEEEVEVPTDAIYDDVEAGRSKIQEKTTTPIGIENNTDYVEMSFENEEEDVEGVPKSFEIGKAPDSKELVAPATEAFGAAPGASEPSPPSSLGSFGSPPGPRAFGTPPRASEPISGSFGIGRAPDPPEPLSFGIGRAPPGSGSAPSAPSSPPVTSTPFPTLLVDQVEQFFNDAGSSSSLGSFGSTEVREVANIAVDQHLEILEDVPTTTRPPPRKLRPQKKTATGIFGTKVASLNERAYKPPMFPSPMSSLAIRMPTRGDPYIQRTTVAPIGPHGLAEQQNGDVTSVDMELPAWGAHKDHGIINKARREYQKEFEQQIRDVRMIDEEINRISAINDEGRSKQAQKCAQVYAHTLSLPQIEQMSRSLGLADVATTILKASETRETQNEDISQLEVDLEEKRKLIAQIEILLSLAESRAQLFDLLNEQKRIVERMENQALDMLQKTNFKPSPPNLFSAASDISELSSAVRQVLGAQQPAPKPKIATKGRSMMKQQQRKTAKKLNFVELIPQQSAAAAAKTQGHLQETAEIVEPVLVGQKFGRAPMAVAVVHRRPLPVAPPTMNPLDFKFATPPSPARSQARAAHAHSPARALRPPTDEEMVMSESETVHELIDMLHEDIVKLPEEEELQVCRQVQCDFEKADLCNLESSHDETTRLLQKASQKVVAKRNRRSTDDLLAEPSTIADDLLPYTFRAWSIWAGRRGEKQKQIDIGPDFSPSNTHFAAVFLETQQAGILSMPLILSGTSTRIRLRVFEASRGMRLRVCCDRYCPLETETGLYRGHKMWLRKTITCPPNTQTLSFECLNEGPDRGACGVDDIFVDSSRCRHFFDGADQS